MTRGGTVRRPPAVLGIPWPGALAAGPEGGGPGPGCETGRMPVLDPHPQNSQKKLLAVLGLMLVITVVIGVIASVASP